MKPHNLTKISSITMGNWMSLINYKQLISDCVRVRQTCLPCSLQSRKKYQIISIAMAFWMFYCFLKWIDMLIQLSKPEFYWNRHELYYVKWYRPGKSRSYEWRSLEKETNKMACVLVLIHLLFPFECFLCKIVGCWMFAITFVHCIQFHNIGVAQMCALSNFGQIRLILWMKNN